MNAKNPAITKSINAIMKRISRIAEIAIIAGENTINSTMPRINIIKKATKPIKNLKKFFIF